MKSKSFMIGIIVSMFFIGTLGADDVMFNYQGRVKIQGQLFTGTEQFKFAIINNAGNVTLWSNDGTSTGGNQPTASVSITVTDGIFNVIVGDPDLGMLAINRSVFNHPSQIKLRIWFSDGVHGFQQLLPDHKLVNVELLGIATGEDDFTIYVNGTTGNDENNGLSPSKAKKTIQAAVDVLPVRLKCSVTIDIADGVYRETLRVFAIIPEYPKTLTFVGDETWTPSSPSDPAVRVTGNDDDVSAVKVRDYALHANNTSYVYFQGIQFDNGNRASALITNGGCLFNNCKFSDATKEGLYVALNSNANIFSCLAENNGEFGVRIYNHSYSNIQNSIFKYNVKSGLNLDVHSSAFFPPGTTGDFHHNGKGVSISINSSIYFDNAYSGQIHDNTNYGLQILYDSHTHGHTRNTFSNNGSGAADDVNTNYGGNAY